MLAAVCRITKNYKKKIIQFFGCFLSGKIQLHSYDIQGILTVRFNGEWLVK